MNEDEAKRDLVRRWLVKAWHDLAAAGKLAGGPDVYLDVAIYHCQQAAEKALKAFLVFHDQRFQKTHDLRVLVELARPFDATIDQCLDLAERLTPYATAFRYPSEVLDPDTERFQEALEAADMIYRFVLARLPQEAHP
jgi:HEPN domain-containing protein